MQQNKFYPSKKYRWTNYPLSFIKEMLLARRANEKDNIILVTGSRGEGKSTFAGKILFQFDDFKPFENIVYTKEAMFREARKKYNYIWGDESIINVARGNVMTRGNKLLHELFTISRNNFNITFLCLPYVEDFDTKILQYVSLWCHIDTRGLGVIMLPSNKGLFGKRNWDIDGMRKMYDEFVKDTKGERRAPYWLYPNFRGYVRFGKLTKEQDAIVNEIKEIEKNKNLSKELQAETKVAVSEMENYNKYSAKKLAEAVAKGEIRSKEQFNRTCIEMKLEPELMMKKCDLLIKKQFGKSARGMIKALEREDAKIKF